MGLFSAVFFQKAAEGFAAFGMFQTVGDGGFEVAQFAAAVVARAFKVVRQDKFVIEQLGDAVCKLDFVARAARQSGQEVENALGEDVASDDGKVGGRVFGLVFFDNADNALELFELFGFDDAV